MESESEEIPDYSPLLKGSIWSLTIVASVFLALRVYAKSFWKRSLWWDDAFLIVSWVCLLLSAALLTEGVKWGIGLHYEDMDLEKMPKAALFSYAAAFATILGTAWSKTSFGITLLRISSGYATWLVWFIIASVNLVLGASAVLLWIQCWPLKKLLSDAEEGTCWPRLIGERYQTFCSVYSGVTDIVLALLPWKIVWNATIVRREKIGALVAMSIGVVSGLMSFMKIISLDEISDVSSTTVDLKILGIAELATTITAASIPVLRAFVRRGRSPASRSNFIRLSRLPTVDSSGLQESGKGGVSPTEMSVAQTDDSWSRSQRRSL